MLHTYHLRPILKRELILDNWPGMSNNCKYKKQSRLDFKRLLAEMRCLQLHHCRPRLFKKRDGVICRTSDHHNHYHNLNLKGVRRCIFWGVRWCTTLSRPNAFTLMLAHTYRILPIHRREKIVIQHKVPQNPCVVHRRNFLSKYIVDSRFYYLLWFLKKNLYMFELLCW